MTKSKTNPKVDGYLRNAKRWPEEFEKLRAIALGCQLTEELKWGHPCYSLQGRNIVLIHGFKEAPARDRSSSSARLKDARKLPVKPGENTQASRQIRFTNVAKSRS